VAEDDTNFLSRWARRKQAVREAEEVPAEPAEAATEPAAETDDARRPLTEEEVAALPDPDTLGPGDDFKAFLRQGVPEDLKRRALRRLWRSNPVFGFLDGMNDYDLDYTDAATVVANLKTVFQVGKGVVLPEDEQAAEPVTARADAAQEALDGKAKPETDSLESDASEAAGEPETEPASGPEPATEDRDRAGADHIPEVERTAPGARLPGLEPEPLQAREAAPDRPRGRAALRRWGGFAPIPAEDAKDSEG
jgi:hypothetical protein